MTRNVLPSYLVTTQPGQTDGDSPSEDCGQMRVMDELRMQMH